MSRRIEEIPVPPALMPPALEAAAKAICAGIVRQSAAIEALEVARTLIWQTYCAGWSVGRRLGDNEATDRAYVKACRAMAGRE